jgi:SAM-dependent methyltransferase
MVSLDDAKYVLLNGARMSRLGVGILRALSRSPAEDDYALLDWSAENALGRLCSSFPGFVSIISGCRVADYGCGDGWQSVGMAEAGAAEVLGIDTNRRVLAAARKRVVESSTSGDVTFCRKINELHYDYFDVVISQNSMEHFPDPDEALREMAIITRSGGRIFITFSAPWYSPWGSHMQFFTRVPWVNLIFSEETVMSVRSAFRGDGAKRYEDVESGLNRMSVARFERLVKSVGLVTVFSRYDCVRGWNLFNLVPFVRELFVNRISVELKKI